MLIEIPYRESEEKEDVQLHFESDRGRSITEEEKVCLDKLVDYLTQCKIGFYGKWSTNFIKISKGENGLVVEINENLIKGEKC